MNTVTDIADAVADELNGADAGTFGTAFTAVRRVLPKFEIADLSEVKVSVVPKSIGIEQATRSHRLCDVSVDIGIQQKVAKDVDSSIEDLMELVEDIGFYMADRQLTVSGPDGVVFVSMDNDPIYSPEHLAESLVFTSVITLTYRLLK